MPCLHAALLDCERAAVDDLIRNPMGLSSSRGAAGEGPPPAHEKDGAFVLLQRLRILPKNDGYAYVSDLDAFFSSLYNYYYMRGLGAIVGKGLVELVSLFFTLWLSLVLFAYIDWGALSQCNDEKTCHESFIEAYVVPSPFSSGEGRWLRNAWIITYCLLFSVYGLFCLVQYGHAVIASMESKLFLEEILAVSDKDLEMGRVEWEDIVERMSEAQRVGKCVSVCACVSACEIALPSIDAEGRPSLKFACTRPGGHPSRTGTRKDRDRGLAVAEPLVRDPAGRRRGRRRPHGSPCGGAADHAAGELPDRVLQPGAARPHRPRDALVLVVADARAARGQKSLLLEEHRVEPLLLRFKLHVQSLTEDPARVLQRSVLAAATVPPVRRGARHFHALPAVLRDPSFFHVERVRLAIHQRVPRAEGMVADGEMAVQRIQ